MEYKRALKRAISFMIVFVLAFQCTLGVFAESMDKNQMIEKPVKQTKKVLPKAKIAKTKSTHKLPPGLVKKEDALEKWKGKKEIIENRTENSKTYVNEDGTLTSAVFMQPIHIKDKKGNLVDIDNTLVSIKEGSKYSHKNKLGAFDAFFSGKAAKNGSIKLEKNNITIEIIAMDTTTEDMLIEENSVVYKGTNRGVEHLYAVGYNGIKEDIILYKNIEKPEFCYELDIKGAAEAYQEEGLIYIVDKKSSGPIFTLSAPFMEDNQGNQSFDLSMKLSNNKGKQIITLKADEQWLKDPKRVYPVRIDPSVTVAAVEAVATSKGEAMVDDNFTQQKGTSSSHSHEFMIYVGYDDGYASSNRRLYNTWKEKTRGYIKFNIPTAVKQNAGIISANINLYQYTSWGTTTRQMDIWELPSGTAINNLKWPIQPAPSSPVMTVQISPATGWQRWDILELASKWINGNNNGLGMKMHDENAQAECFYSSNHTVNSKLPYLEIRYKTKETEPTPVETGDLELVLERSDIMQNGTAYGKGTLSGGNPESGKNRATITYKLMPDGASKTITKENFDTFDWETEKFNLEVDKTYWIEANIKLEHLIVPVSNDPNVPPAAPYYKEVLNESKTTSKFVVGEAQPGDTLKRLAKHYLNTGSKFEEIKQLNKLDKEALLVGQKLFVLTDKSKALSYKQPKQITTEIELKDMASGSAAVNTELVGQFINPHNGNLAYLNTDFGFTSYNLDLAMIRSHSSILENRKSPLGDKWDYSFNKYLFFYKDGTIGYNTGDGSRIYFKKDGLGYKTIAPVYYSLSNAGDFYELKTADNTRYRFSMTGLLTKILDKNNNETKVEYNKNDWQTTITAADMRTISLEYFDSDSAWCGNISTVTMPSGASVEYTYVSGANTLEQYVDPDGYTYKYTYDNKQRMLTMLNPLGNVSISNEYDASGRVKLQKDGEEILIKLDYQIGRTSFTDGKGYVYSYSYSNNYWLTNKEYPDKLTEAYSYNPKGDITKRADRMNRTHNYEYNSLGFVTKYIRPDAKFMQYSYKNGYLLEAIKDFEGNLTKLYYDNNNNLDREVKYVTENGQKTEITTDYSFTPQGLLSSVIDPDGVTTTYDNSSYPSTQLVRDGDNNTYQYYFDAMGRLLNAIDPKGYVTSIIYDNRGNTIFTIYPSSDGVDRYTEYNYDENGSLKSETSSRILEDEGISPTTVYDYYKNNKLKTITDPYGYTTTYGYDNNGNMNWELDQEQTKTDYDYNMLNRLKTIKYQGQSSYAYIYDYDALGNIKKVVEADGDWTQYTYNYDVNKLEAVLKPEGYSASYSYNAMGNIKEEILPDKNKITYDYDELYRVKTITEPGDKLTTVSYKDSGRVKEINDYTDKSFIYEYYPDGQLLKTTEIYKDPLTSQDMKYETAYTYDANGNMETICDESGQITTYNYNEINMVSKGIDPLNKTKSYTYDEEGNVSTITDGENNITIMKYDALNRLNTVTIPSGNVGLTQSLSEDTCYTYLYNKRGMLEYYIDPMQNLTTYSYNPLGRMEKVTNAKGEAISYQYYTDGNLQKIIYPNQQYEEYRYDGLNRAIWTKDRSGVEQTVVYRVTGQPDLISDSVGNRLDYQYDELGRLETIIDVLNRTEVYTYDKAGNVQSVKGMDNTTTEYINDPRGRIRKVIDSENKATIMEYNAKNQVTQIQKPGNRVYSYDYDSSGNLWRVADPAKNKTEYYYNNNNQVKEIIDARGYSKKYEYNELNMLKKAINERNYATTYEYYPGGSLKTVTDPKGYETKYQYDELNRVAAVENPLQEKTIYDYDAIGNVAKMVDPRGVTTRYSYNARDQLECTYDTQGHRTQNIYYPNGNLMKEIDEENHVTAYEYDAVHRITKLIEAGEYTKNYVYNANTGDIDKMYDNAGKSTVYEYDNAHRLLKETNEQGHLTEYTYDDFGNLKTKKTPDSNMVNYSYDILDRVTKILDPENKLTEISYDPMGNIQTVIKPENQKYTYTYDPANNVEKIIDPLGQATTYTYDPNDNIATMLDPSGNLFNYNFDPLNRLESVIDSTNSGTQYHYDHSGNIDRVTDGNNNTTYYGYDNLNRLEWVKDAEGYTTSYTYFADGKLKSMTDANGQTSSYTYDEAGNLATFKNPMGEIKSLQYTLLNQIKGITKPDGRQTNYNYDKYNRLSNITYPGGDTVEYTYDELNRKIGMTDPNGVSSYQYDSMDRLTKVTDAAEEEVKYEYDEKGRKSKLIYPDEKYVTYGYDEHDRLITVTDREGRVTSYTYDEAGRQKTTKYPNGITTTYTYDKAGKIVKIENKGTGGKIIEKISYSYDKAGNKITEEIWQEEYHYLRQYTYYKNNTVKSMKETGDNEAEYSYKYDGAGNITEKTVVDDGISTTYSYSYNQANRLIEEKENGKTSKLYRYDANGNRTEVVISAGEVAEGEDETKEEVDYYYYDDEDRLIEIVEHNGKQFTYGYDGEGNRIGRTYSQTPVVKDKKEKPDKDKNNKDKGNKEKDNGKKTEEESLSLKTMSKGEKDVKDKDKDKEQPKNDNSNDNTKDNNKDKNNKDKKGNDNKKKDNTKENQGKHLGWYKRLTHPKNPNGIEITEPEVFEVTNYINDINRENTEILMTSDIDGNYWGVYTYGIDRISAEDLVSVEGVPNNPLYYLYDALGTTTAITNMNQGIIDSNRFAPYGEALDPVAKNSRRTNSPFGFTGEAHDIEAGLVYLRARYYEPETMRFLQQDTMLGDINEPLTRNLYIYGNANPLTYVDPSGHRPVNVADNAIGKWIKYGDRGADVKKVQNGLNVWSYAKGEDIGKHLQSLKVDGIFGTKTKARVNTFKNTNHIRNNGYYNGVVDQKTWNELKPYMSGSGYKPKTPTVQGTGKDGSLEDDYNLSEWKSSDRLKIDIKGNTVHIYWCVIIKGEDADDNFTGTNQIYKEKIQKAIEEKWSGQYNINGHDIKVITSVEVLNDGKDHIIASDQKSSTINFYNEADISCMYSHGKFLIFFENGSWEKSNPGTINMYAGDSRNGKDDRYNSDTFDVVIAHEFGHILGIKDGYKDSETKGIDSIMCDEFGSRNNIDIADRKATNLDIKKGLDAYQKNSWQYWP